MTSKSKRPVCIHTDSFFGDQESDSKFREYPGGEKTPQNPKPKTDQRQHRTLYTKNQVSKKTLPHFTKVSFSFP
jgi:hypothetical protein